MSGYVHAIWGRGPILWLFVALLVTFAVTRYVTRRIRAGSTSLRNWSAGGIHLHHQVFGIFGLLVAGCLEFAYRPAAPWSDLLAAMFGAGIALTLDEFALWLHLDDVYWKEEGRSSLDAVFIAIVVIGALVAGLSPLDVPGASLGGPIWLGVVAVTISLIIVLLPVVITALKGKLVSAMVGIFVWPVAVASAIRLAKPRSPWARSRYRPRSRKLVRAEARFGPAYEARWNRLRDLIGGAPHR